MSRNIEAAARAPFSGLRTLEENARLKKLLVEATLDNVVLKDLG